MGVSGQHAGIPGGPVEAPAGHRSRERGKAGEGEKEARRASLFRQGVQAHKASPGPQIKGAGPKRDAREGEVSEEREVFHLQRNCALAVVIPKRKNLTVAGE